MGQHTPGPWEVDGDGFIVGGEGDASNAVFLRFITAPVVSVEHNPADGESQANARLMAAAPDLLKSLKAMLEEFAPAPGQSLTAGVVTGAVIFEAEYAVAKAEGHA